MIITAPHSYLRLLDEVRRQKDGPSPRGMSTREIIGHTSMVDMGSPIVDLPERRLSYKFMGAEALWILSGSREIHFHRQISDKLARYSDDSWSLSGAYGPQFLSQYRYVVDCLSNDMDTRQAVITLWSPNPRPSKDIPCTVAMQFLIRDQWLHLNVSMRSSDAWMGWPYDVFSFTMMATFIGLHYHRRTKMPIDLGALRIFAGSQHLYSTNYAEADALLKQYASAEVIGGPRALSLSRHNDPEDLLVELRNMANNGLVQ